MDKIINLIQLSVAYRVAHWLGHHWALWTSPPSQPATAAAVTAAATAAAEAAGDDWGGIPCPSPDPDGWLRGRTQSGRICWGVSPSGEWEWQVHSPGVVQISMKGGPGRRPSIEIAETARSRHVTAALWAAEIGLCEAAEIETAVRRRFGGEAWAAFVAAQAARAAWVTATTEVVAWSAAAASAAKTASAEADQAAEAAFERGLLAPIERHPPLHAAVRDKRPVPNV